MNGHGDFKQYGPQAKWLLLGRSPVQEHGVLHWDRAEDSPSRVKRLINTCFWDKSRKMGSQQSVRLKISFGFCPDRWEGRA
jgi:hypothetical protein